MGHWYRLLIVGISGFVVKLAYTFSFTLFWNDVLRGFGKKVGRGQRPEKEQRSLSESGIHLRKGVVLSEGDISPELSSKLLLPQFLKGLMMCARPSQKPFDDSSVILNFMEKGALWITSPQMRYANKGALNWLVGFLIYFDFLWIGAHTRCPFGSNKLAFCLFHFLSQLLFKISNKLVFFLALWK